MKKECAYPDCVNHKPGAKTYCCTGCRWDHEDLDPTILDAKPEPVKVPIGAHALLTFGAQPVVLTEDFIAEAEKWFERHLKDGWEREYCETQAWMVLLNGAHHSTDYDPTQRYAMERGQFDALWYVVDTTQLSRYLHETKFHSIARCYKKPDANKIVKALNEYNQPKTARRKNGN